MIGRTISHYKIIEKLGEGGMGVVYKAEDLRLKRTVALKFLPPQLTRDERAKKRFVHEAQAASALQHNNICTIHEIDDTPDGQMFICMDYYPGESLEKRTSKGPLPLDEAVDIARQGAAGLARAHESGIVHRDIKPANIAVTQDGVVKILDFGLAKLSDRTRVTREGTTLGTISYMSPEQARGGEVDGRTDVWALGVLLYEMLTGRLPFRADHDAALFYSIINEPHEPVGGLRPEAPETTRKIVERALAKRPEERYENAGEMARDLEKASEEISNRGRRLKTRGVAERSSVSRSAKFWVPVAVAILALAGIFVVKPGLFGGDVISAPRPIAVISFENQTGDADYDYLREVIPNLLITKLEQSKYLSVLSWERMRDLLDQNGHAGAQLIDRETGFDVCRLDGIDTIVLGSFTRAGDVFVTDVKVLDVRSKNLLKSASTKGKGVESILAKQIDELGGEISRGIGLSERSIAAAGPSVSEVTTASMDAYHFYLKGREEYYNRAPADAMRSLRRAVELDTTFAAAWLYLGRAYRGLRDYKSGAAAYEKAKSLAPSAPEKDRLYIEAAYAMVIAKDDKRRFELLRELVDRYPKEKLAHLELGLYYGSQGMSREAIKSFERALSLNPDYGEALNALAYEYADLEDYPTAVKYLERYAAVSPGEPNPIDSMAEMYFRMGDLDKALELYEKATEIRPDFTAGARIAYLLSLKEDYAGAIEWCDRFIENAPSPGLVGSGHLIRSFYCLFGCRYGESRRSAEEARTVFVRMGIAFSAAGAEWIEGLGRIQEREYDAARRCFMESTSLLEEGAVVTPWLRFELGFVVGLIDVRESRLDAARERLADMKTELVHIDKSDPEKALLARDHAVLIEAEILLAEERFDDAIDLCQTRPDVGIPSISSAEMFFYNTHLDRDVLARAFAARGAVDKAIEEYEHLTTFDPSRKDRRLIFPLFHYRLGRLYEDKGWVARAAAEYRKFLAVTDGAGESVVEIGEARRRLAAVERQILQ